MVCLGIEPMAAEWKAQTNPLCYSGTPTFSNTHYNLYNKFMWNNVCNSRIWTYNVQNMNLLPEPLDLGKYSLFWNSFASSGSFSFLTWAQMGSIPLPRQCMPPLRHPIDPFFAKFKSQICTLHHPLYTSFTFFVLHFFELFASLFVRKFSSSSPYLTSAAISSVTRWPNCVFNIWPFSLLKMCPIAYKLDQSKLKLLHKTK